MNVEHFKEDVRSRLTGNYKLPDGKIVKGQAVSYLLATMRCSRNTGGVLKSNRRWRGLGNLGEFEDTLRKAGFKTTYNSHGERVVRGGSLQFTAKSICVHE